MAKWRLGLLGAAAALAGVGGAWATPEPLTEAQSVALGRMLAVRNCSQCHAIADAGASPNPQAPPFRELYRRGDVEMLGEGGAERLLTGHPAMPEYRFEPHELVALVRYLRSVQTRREM